MLEPPRLDALQAIVRQALALTAARPGEIRAKAAQDHVTDLDLAADRLLSRRLPEVRDVPVLSEERAVDHASPLDEYWIVDPLDGTTNAVAGLPLTAVSVALVDGEGPRIAMVAARDGTLFCAVRGSGAWQDGRPLDLAGRAPRDLIVLSTGLIDVMVARHAPAFAALRQVGKLRNLGSQALHLCGVAAGQFAAVASREARIWDEAAAGLIVREAGGTWSSAADAAPWSEPATLFRREQRSIAAHPARFAAVRQALAPVFESLAAPILADTGRAA